MKTTDKLNSLFDLPAEDNTPATTSIINYNPAEVEQDDDFQLARTTLRNLINKNEDVITELIHISKNSEHPRAFEVTGQLIKTQTEIAKELVGLYKTKKDINKIDKKISNQTNNIVFAGSTSDLMKMINGDKAKVIDVNK